MMTQAQVKEPTLDPVAYIRKWALIYFLVTVSGAMAFAIVHTVVGVIRGTDFTSDLIFFSLVVLAFAYLAITLHRGRGWALLLTCVLMYCISYAWKLDPDHLLGSGYVLIVVAATAVAFESAFGNGRENGNKRRYALPQPFSNVLAFVETRKRYWLMPVVVLGSIFGGLVVITKGPKIAPFVYALF